MCFHSPDKSKPLNWVCLFIKRYSLEPHENHWLEIPTNTVHARKNGGGGKRYVRWVIFYTIDSLVSGIEGFSVKRIEGVASRAEHSSRDILENLLWNLENYHAIIFQPFKFTNSLVYQITIYFTDSTNLKQSFPFRFLEKQSVIWEMLWPENHHFIWIPNVEQILNSIWIYL